MAAPKNDGVERRLMTLRWPVPLVERIDRLAAARGWTRTDWVFKALTAVADQEEAKRG